jgi:hypothetical protein
VNPSATRSVFQFKSDLEGFAKKVNLSASLVVRRVVLDLHGRIVLRTPVDTGRARASWGIDLGVPGDYVVGKKKAQGAEWATIHAKGQEGKITERNALSGMWWIYNNLPYIFALEYGRSRQAPAGMVRVSIAEIEAELS